MRYNKIVRKILLWLTEHVSEKMEQRIFNYLYPDDAIITFK